MKNTYNPLNDAKLLDDINNAFIKKFKTDKNYYIYDVNTNEIVKVDEVIWNLFPDSEKCYIADLSRLQEKHGTDELERALNEIRSSIRKDHYFSSNKPKIGMKMTMKHLEEHIKHKNEQTILNVTEDCNFRCKYCIYSGIYKDTRTHSNKYMTWEIAKAAIDDFLTNSSEVENPAFSFYGGEPLLAIDLIKKSVAYLKEKGKKCHYCITTNGSLLNKNNIRYFIDNNFLLSISLNGPKEIHDLYRVYNSGKGSWDDVNSNIKLIRNIDYEYYRNNVSFICTFLPPYKITQIIDYFDINEPVANVKFSNVDDSVDYFKRNFSKSQLEDDFYNQYSLLFDEYIALFKDQKMYIGRFRLLSDLFESFPVLFHKRANYMLSDMMLSQGQCYMGARRLFVSSSGDYFPCERVKEHYPIGNVINGVNYKKIYEYISMFNNSQKYLCYDCPYIRFCLKCIKSIFSNAMFDKTLFEKMCKSKLTSIKNYLIMYMKLVESDSESLNKIESIKVR